MVRPNNLRAIAGTTAVTTVIQTCSLMSGVILARALSPESRGEFAAILLWPSVFASFGVFGLQTVFARVRANTPGHGHALRKAAWKLTLLLAVVTCSVGIAALPFLLPSDKQHLVLPAQIAFLSVPASILNVLIFSIAQGGGNFRAYNAMRFVFSPAYLVLLLFLWMGAGAGLYVFTVAFVVAALLSALASDRLLAWTEPQRDNLGSVDSVGLLKTAVPYGASYWASAIYAKLDTIWLSLLADSKALGMYTVALSAASLHYSLGQAISSVLFFRVAAYDGPGLSLWLAQRLRKALILNVALTGLGLLVIPPLVPLIFGDEFSGSARLVMVLMPAVSFLSIALIVDESLKAHGIPGAGLRSKLISGAALSVLAVSLVPEMGGMGIALALAGGAAVQVVALLWFATRHFDLSWIQLLAFKVVDVQEIASEVLSLWPKKYRL